MRCVSCRVWGERFVQNQAAIRSRRECRLFYLRELDGDKLGGLFTDVGQSVGETTIDPPGVSISSVQRKWRLAFHVAAQKEIRDRDDEMRPVVMVARDHGPWLQFDLRGADGVFDEENLLCTSIQDLQAAVFVLGGVPR